MLNENIAPKNTTLNSRKVPFILNATLNPKGTNKRMFPITLKAKPFTGSNVIDSKGVILIRAPGSPIPNSG